MSDYVVVTLRPVSDRDFYDVKVTVELKDGNYNRAVKQAIRSVTSQYPKKAVHHFEVLSIEQF